MASSTTTTTSSGSEGDLNHGMVVDERKRKRMASNRESARRSRMRKQKHMDDLTAQIAQLVTENNQVVQTINVTTQQFLNVEAENSVLRAQMGELSQRLQSLNDILNYMNTLNNGVGLGTLEEDSLGIFDNHGMSDFGMMHGYNGNFTHNNNDPWNLVYANQPIMASADTFQY